MVCDPFPTFSNCSDISANIIMSDSEAGPSRPKRQRTFKNPRKLTHEELESLLNDSDFDDEDDYMPSSDNASSGSEESDAGMYWNIDFFVLLDVIIGYCLKFMIAKLITRFYYNLFF